MSELKANDQKAPGAGGGVMRANINRREIVFLVVLVITLLFTYNKLNISKNRWTLHPDDHNVYYFSEVLLNTGHLSYESPFNAEYETLAFQPRMDDAGEEGSDRYRTKADYSPGIYFLTCLGHFAGVSGPFVIVSLIGLAGILFFYLFAREIFTRSIAMYSTVFLALSSAYAYWSNMLFTNIPALSFFMGGLYYLARSIKDGSKRRCYLLSAAFFVISVWIRYEYILFLAIVAVAVLIGYRHDLKGTYVLQSVALMALMGASVALINYFTMGSPVGMGAAAVAGRTAMDTTVKYAVSSFSLKAVLTNARMYIYGIAPALTVLGLLGIVLCLRRERNGFTCMLVAIALFALCYYGKNSGFWGYGENWLASSYTRYFLPVIMCLSLFGGVFTERLVRSIPYRKIAIITGAVILIAVTVTSLGVLFDNEFGLSFTDKYDGNRKSVEEYVSTLPESSVVTDLTSDNYYRFIIVSRTVFNPSYFSEDELEERMIEVFEGLRADGVPLYIIDNIDRTLLDIEVFKKKHSHIQLTKVEHPILFQYGTRTPDIYRVEIAPDPGRLSTGHQDAP
ncbi:MAG: glycosyltransferase family 39 protein [Actinomycetia bacterium]|nr:glycosyltransferase family 39 protein [Actinomycetes bacterium]